MTENYGTLPFVCPKCGEELKTDGKTAICRGRHSYDKSRYGYYNLLLTSVGGTHGDNREMILARRVFLGAGYYLPLVSRICELTLEYTPSGGTVLDAGCGEGYYTDAVERALFSRDNLTRVMAFDISKDAVREAARKNSHISLAVAGCYSMPVADGSVNTVINTFSPFAREEIYRSLVTGGALIMAIPERDHLYELKELLYKTPYKNDVKDSRIEGFTLAHDERLTFRMRLDSPESILSLFKMTPYAYRTSPESAEKLLSLTSLECAADFHIFVYRKDL